MIVQIGSFQFNIEASYDTLSKESSWEWAEIGILENAPSLQLTGKAAERITLSGTFFNYEKTGDYAESLYDLADAGEALGLTDDSGVFYGFWVVESLKRTGTIFRKEQEAAIKTTWELSLKKYGDTV